MTLSGRDAYRDELTRLAGQDERILCLEADLGGKDHPFLARHPDRFFNLGIAEAAMLDMAGALAVAGYKPFVSTFAPFAVLRAAESLKLTLGYLGAGVTVVAPYAGVSGAWFGTTHHCLEDFAVVRSIPGVVVAAPYGEQEMRSVVRSAAESGLPHYIRTGRNAAYSSLPGRATEGRATEGRATEGRATEGRATEVSALNWEHLGQPDTVCLVSAGEEATRLCLAARRQRPDLAHGHLCYLDYAHLTVAATQLTQRHRRFVVVEEHRREGGIAEALSLLLPRSEITGVNAGHGWPTQAGDHEEVMAQLSLDLPAVLTAVAVAEGG